MTTSQYQDFSFPSELYNKHDGTFTKPISTLLCFVPLVVQALEEDSGTAKPKIVDWKSIVGGDVVREATRDVEGKKKKRTESEQFEWAEEGKIQEIEEESISIYSGSSDRQPSRQPTINSISVDASKVEEAPKQRRQSNSSTTSNTNSWKQSATNILNASASSASSLLAFAKSKDLSQPESAFHQQYYHSLSQVTKILESMKNWTLERQTHGHEIPAVVWTDIRKLTRLVELLSRIDTRKLKFQKSLIFASGALGIGCLTAGVLSDSSISSKLVRAGLAVLLGTAGVGVGITSYLESNYYRSSLRAFTSQIKFILQNDGWEDLQTHALVVLQSFGLPTPQLQRMRTARSHSQYSQSGAFVTPSSGTFPQVFTPLNASMASQGGRGRKSRMSRGSQGVTSMKSIGSNSSLATTASSISITSTSTTRPHRVLNPFMASFFE